MKDTIHELRDRTRLVLGCPGAGKTYHLETKVLPQLARSYGADGLYCVSLTRAAAKELGGRTALDDEQCRTLHSYAWAYNKPREVLESFGGIREWNRRETGFVLTRALLGLRETRGEYLPMNPHEQLYQEVNFLLSTMVDPEDPAWGPDHKRMLRCLEAARADGLWDFTGLVWDMHRRGRALVPGGVSAVVVDEAQDMSPLDLAAIWEGARTADVREIFFAGDPDQAIYEFRGASRAAFLVDLPEEQIVRLEHSRRCPSAVARAAQLYLSSQPAYCEQVMHWEGDREGGAVLPADHCAEAPEELVSEVRELVQDGKDVMFLCSTNHALKPMRAALDAEGVPHRTFSSEHQTVDNKASRALRRLLDMGENKPVTPVHVWQFAKMMRGTDFRWKFKDHLAEVVRDIEKVQDSGKLAQYLEDHNLHSLGINDATSFNATFKEEFAGLTPLERDIKFLPDELKALMRECAYAVDSDDVLPILRMMYQKWPRKLRGEITAVAEIVKRQGLNSLLYGKAVVVDTIHQVKGGEADVVYLSPDLSLIEATEMALGDEAQRTRVVSGMLRRFYVGMTRAREEVRVLQPSPGKESVSFSKVFLVDEPLGA